MGGLPSPLGLMITTMVLLLLGAPPEPLWSYRARSLGPDGALGLEAQFPPGSSPQLRLSEAAWPFVDELEVAGEEGEFRRLGPERRAPECQQGCRLRYTFALGRATRALQGTAGSTPFEGGWLTSTSLWLVRPDRAPARGRYRLRFEPTAGQRFLSGLSPIDALTSEGPAAYVSPSPYAVLGTLTVRRLRFGDRQVDLAYPPGRFRMGDDALEAWVTQSLKSVADYFGSFPVPYALVVIVPTSGHGAGRATAMGFGGASVRLDLGQATTQAELDEIWELTHELCHLALPNLGRPHHWLEEGLATYLEPIVRVRAGTLSKARYWKELRNGLPQGLPEPGAHGFDGTHSWGETYWGGALYFFLADLQIRRQSQGKKSLDDALRSIVLAGLDLRSWSEVEDVLQVGDQAIGSTVLVDLYRKMAKAPYPLRLEPIWKSLGVLGRGEEVRFDDRAPEAKLREAFTAGPR